MEQILGSCEGCCIYIDDIVVYGSSKEQHDSRLQEVLRRLKKFNVKLNRDKCVYGSTTIIFLGHQLSSDGIKPAYDKISAIKQFRDPINMEETRSFLGLVTYVGKFIPNLATITAPLRKLIKAGTQFEWGFEQKKAFQQLKDYLSDETKLGYYNVNHRTQVIADASPVGLGAVLIQFDRDEPRVISYASRSLSQTEMKYAQTEKEALALTWAVERFHYYLYGKEFELITDHKALETIFSSKTTPCARIQRWALRLQCYKFTVKYKAGKLNIADPLSRLVKYSTNEPSSTEPCDDMYVSWILSYAEPKAMSLNEIDLKSQEDETILSVKDAVYNNVWNDLSAPFRPFQTELCFQGNILLREHRIVIPQCQRSRILQLSHEGHPGINKMKRRLRAKVWWPKMDNDATLFVKKCEGCILTGACQPPEPMRPTDLPTSPWQHIAIDFLGPLPSGHHLLMVTDYYSRYLEVEPMVNTDANSTIRLLQRMFARFGLPESIKADNGPPFNSQTFNQYCDTNQIQLRNTTPYSPEQNGLIERQNRSILKSLQISQHQKNDWQEELQKYLLMYRSSPHSTLLKSPAELMFNRKIRDKLPNIKHSLDLDEGNVDEEIRDRDKESKSKMKEYGDLKRHAKISDVVEATQLFSKGKQKPTNFLRHMIRCLIKLFGEMVLNYWSNKNRQKNDIDEM